MSELKMKYFVLNPKAKHKHDRYAEASREAMKAYARVIQKVNEPLAKELLLWVDSEINHSIKF